MRYKLIRNAPYSWSLYYKKHWYNKWKLYIKHIQYDNYSYCTKTCFHTYIDAIKAIPNRIVEFKTL